MIKEGRARDAAAGGRRRVSAWRIIGWGGVLLLLILPFVAMQFTREVNWTAGDFIFAALMFATAGCTIELAARASGNWAYRGGAIAAVAACFLLVWVNGAVGFLGDEGNPANLMFLGVIAIAIVGSFAAGFRPAGMARAMSAALAAQLLAGTIGLAFGLGAPGFAGIHEVAVGTTLFGGLWLLAMWLFTKAAKEQANDHPV